jgi:hypothetical protein
MEEEGQAERARGKDQGKKQGLRDRPRGRKGEGRAGGRTPCGSRVHRPRWPARPSAAPSGPEPPARGCKMGRAPCAQPLAGGGDAARALGSGRGPGRLQECTTARPARPSAPRRPGARASLGPRGGRAASGEPAWARTRNSELPTCCSSRAARARRGPGPSPPHATPHRQARACAHAGAPWPARARTSLPARGSRGCAGSAFFPPRSSPFPSIWVSFFPFFLLFFFSMNTHRVHLKATLPHFTTSVSTAGVSAVQFSKEKKKRKRKMKQNTGFLGLVSTAGRNLTRKCKRNIPLYRKWFILFYFKSSSNKKRRNLLCRV